VTFDRFDFDPTTHRFDLRTALRKPQSRRARVLAGREIGLEGPHPNQVRHSRSTVVHIYRKLIAVQPYLDRDRLTAIASPNRIVGKIHESRECPAGTLDLDNGNRSYDRQTAPGMKPLDDSNNTPQRLSKQARLIVLRFIGSRRFHQTIDHSQRIIRQCDNRQCQFSSLTIQDVCLSESSPMAPDDLQRFPEIVRPACKNPTLPTRYAHPCPSVPKHFGIASPPKQQQSNSRGLRRNDMCLNEC